MAPGQRRTEQQQELWVATSKPPVSIRHVFYDALNGVLRDAKFDSFAESLCGPFYKEGGRRDIPPGIYFRMIFVDYFEGIGSQRGIARRCSNSLSLRKFLGYELHKRTPDHSSMTRIRQRLPLDVFEQVFAFVLSLVKKHRPLKGKIVGVDSTLLEANAAMKSIVRKDTGEDWEISSDSSTPKTHSPPPAVNNTARNLSHQPAPYDVLVTEKKGLRILWWAFSFRESWMATANHSLSALAANG